MKLTSMLIAIVLISLLSGCATVPMAPLELDTEAKTFTPPRDKASIYIYRNEILGAAIPVTVSINDRTIGQTASKTYFRFNVNPGKYNIKALAENTAELSLSTTAGNSYFVWQEMKMGMWMARANLVQVDQSVGQAAVSECKLIASTVTDGDLEATSSSFVPTGGQTTGTDMSASEKIRELKKLNDEGVITDSEFEEKKAKLLDEL